MSTMANAGAATLETGVGRLEVTMVLSTRSMKAAINRVNRAVQLRLRCGGGGGVRC
jgi:hypothetical protein